MWVIMSTYLIHYRICYSWWGTNFQGIICGINYLIRIFLVHALYMLIGKKSYMHISVNMMFYMIGPRILVSPRAPKISGPTLTTTRQTGALPAAAQQQRRRETRMLRSRRWATQLTTGGRRRDDGRPARCICVLEGCWARERMSDELRAIDWTGEQPWTE